MGLLRRSFVVLLSGVVIAASGGVVADAAQAVPPRAATSIGAEVTSTAEPMEPVVWEAPTAVNRTPVGQVPTDRWVYDPAAIVEEDLGLRLPEDAAGVSDLPDVPIVDPISDPVVAPDDSETDPPGTTPSMAPATGLNRVPGSGSMSSKSAAGGGASVMSSPATTAGQDLTGDGNPDVIARDSTGKLWTYPGTASGTLGTRIQAGASGWNDFDQVHIVGNFNGVGGNDVIARKPSTGQLFLFPGASNGTVGTGTAIGVGWNSMRELSPVGDLTGDGKADLAAMHATDGKVYLYPGSGTGGFGSGTVIGVGFGSYTALVGTGDWNGDGDGDFIARGSNGRLYAFYGAGNGTVASGGQVGVGWAGFTSFIGAADRNSDTNSDILVRASAGTLHLYRGNGTGGFLSNAQIGTGWNGLIMNEPTTSTPAVPDTGDDAVAKPGLGAQEFYGFEEFGLAENLSAAVNLANGNLLVRNTDLAVNGPGIGLRLDRFYNSLSSRTGAYGPSWSISAGQDVGLEITSTKVIFRAPSGFRGVFTSSGTSWVPASGLKADLVENSNGTWTVTYRSNGEVLNFTAGGYLTSDKDRNGNALTFAYTAANELASVTDAAGRVTTFTYTGGVLTRITDPAARQNNFVYANGQKLTSSEDAANASTTYRYDSAGRLDRIRTPRGSTTLFTYDTSDRIASVTKYTALNSTVGAQTTTFTYTANGSGGTTVQTNPLSQATTYTWDTSGRVTKVKDALNRERSQTWTANSGVATTTDAMGSGGAGGNITSYTYDAANNPTQVALPTGAAATAVYSTGGSCGSTDTAHPYQAKCATDDAGNRTSYTYDTAGNTLKAQDTTPNGSGQPTAGRSLTKTYQGTSGATCSAKTGQICSETDGRNNATSYTYDTDGNLATSTPPAPLGASSYGYDSLGRLTSYTDGKGQTTTYGYDVLDHRTRTTVAGPAGTGDRYSTWDGDGNQTSDDAELTTYDAQNRASTTFPAGAGSAGSGWQLTRDAAGNITSTNDNINRTTTYTVDAAGQVTAVAEPGGTCPTSGTGTKCTRFTYDNNGKRTTTTYPGGTVETTTRDNAGRATRIRAVNSASTVLSDLAYSYAITGGSGPTADRSKVQSRTDHLGVGGPAGSVTRYGYDTLKRLTAATETTSTGGVSASWAYTYDNAGNRLTQVRTGNTGITAGTTNYAYNAADQLTSINNSSTGLSYDANGNQTGSPGLPAAGIPAHTSTVNTGDQVKSISVGGTATSFDYNGTSNDNRIKTGSTDTLTSLLGLEHTGNDASGTSVKYLKTPDGTTLGTTATSANPNSAYFLRDNLGSVVAIVNATGTKTATYSYDPYGITRTATGTAAAANPLRYTGGYRDTTTGLYKLGVRYYDPSTGRFTQPDPTGQEQNHYLYAGGDPCNKTDPSGGVGECVNSLLLLGIGIVGIVGGIAALATATVATGGLALGFAIVSVLGGSYTVPFGIDDAIESC